jgi:hypothetical protein
VVHLAQPVLDAVLVAHAVEDVPAIVDIAFARGELDAVVGQDRVDLVGHGLDQFAQELGRFHLACAFHETSKGELAGAVDSYEQPQLAFFRPHLGDVDVKVADWVGLEALLLRLVALHRRQAADAVPLQAAVQRRARQMRDAGLEGVEAVIQRQ